MREWRAKNPDKQRANRTADYRRNRQKYLAIHRERFKNDGGKIRLRNKEWHESEAGKAFLSVYTKSKKYKFSAYRNMAKGRDLPFMLSFEEFESFWQKSCFYCGDGIDTVGIDRVDSDLGYTMQNCVPCCRSCNQAKNDLSQNEFFDMCMKVVMRHMLKDA
jgi:5-methylcytosine-specific restriction endonuclease McrA